MYQTHAPRVYVYFSNLTHTHPQSVLCILCITPTENHPILYPHPNTLHLTGSISKQRLLWCVFYKTETATWLLSIQYYTGRTLNSPYKKNARMITSYLLFLAKCDLYGHTKIKIQYRTEESGAIEGQVKVIIITNCRKGLSL